MKKKKNGYKKEVVKHLKSDIKTFYDEASEDKELIKNLSKKRIVKKKVVPKKKRAVKKKRDHEKIEKPGHEKFEKVMREFKEGKLHSGSKKGPKVRKLSQARAIAFKYDREADGTSKKPKRRLKKK